MKRTHQILALAAIILSSLAWISGDFEQYDSIVATQKIDVFELARMMQKRESLLLVDLREQQERQTFSLPGAVSLATAKTRIAQQSFNAVVVYGHEQHRGWLSLLNHNQNLLFLDYGPQVWIQNILSPVIYRHADTEELALFEQRAPLSRYFGGLPRISDEPVPIFDPEKQLADLKRRGCGF